MYALDLATVGFALLGAVVPLAVLPRHWSRPGVPWLIGMVVCFNAYVVAAMLLSPWIGPEPCFLFAGLIAPLYAFATSDFLGMTWLSGRRARAAVWIPALGLGLLALTNRWHGWYAELVPPDPALPIMHQMFSRGGIGVYAMEIMSAVLVLGTAAVVGVQFARSRFRTSQLLVVLVFPVLAALAQGINLFCLRYDRYVMDCFVPASIAGLLVLSASLLRWGFLRVRPVARHRLLQVIPDAMAVVSAERFVIDCNATFSDLWGLAPRDVIGRDVGEFLPVGDRSCAREAGVSASLELTLPAGQRFFDLRSRCLERSSGPPDEVLLLRDVTEATRLHRALAARERELSAANAELSRLSTTDPLTGLRNRRYLLDRLEHELECSRRSDSQFGLLAIDLDHFKRINDAHGHECGDAVLVAVSQTMEEICRSVDVVARFGGEEFLVLVVDVGPKGLYRAAERIRAAIASIAIPVSSGATLEVTVSVGAAHSSAAAGAEALLRRADEALYSAKRGGRDRSVAARS